MSGLFPSIFQGGVGAGVDAPGSYKPQGKAQPFVTYYPRGGSPLWTTPQTNALLSEITFIFDKAGVVYQPGSFGNLFGALSALFATGGSGGSGVSQPGVRIVNGKTGERVTLDVTDIEGAAPLNSPEFAGAPTASTPPVWDESERLATTRHVAEKFDNLTAELTVKFIGYLDDEKAAAVAAADAAAGSATSAAASLATFQTYFKGALSSDPLVVVATGAFYFNTTSNRWRIKTASGWADYDGADAAAAAAASLNSLNLKWLGSMSLDPTFAGGGGPPGGTGTFYFNQSSHKLRIYYSGAWHDYDEAAQAAAVAAAGALASFNQKWLGSLEVDPSFAGGSPPGGTGVIYFNSYTHKLRIWDGSAWVNYDASAQAAASSAAASLTSFTQKWLGALEVDPAFSSPPSVGTLYWNSTIGNLRLWNGASWVDFTESAQTAAEIASLTSFSVAMATAYANQSARILALTN